MVEVDGLVEGRGKAICALMVALSSKTSVYTCWLRMRLNATVADVPNGKMPLTSARSSGPYLTQKHLPPD